MKLTGNYNLKKPDGSDVVNIQDINDTVEKIDEELKKINVKADDMSFTTAIDRVNIESGDSRKMVLGKISKWFRDLKGLAFKDKVAVGDLDSSLIAHNLTTTDVGKVLGADQGGVLQGKIGELNENLGNKMQSGQLLMHGSILEYALSCKVTSTIMITQAYYPPDSPFNSVEFFILVFATFGRKTVMVIPYANSSVEIYTRDIFNNDWLDDWSPINNDFVTQDIGQYLVNGWTNVWADEPLLFIKTPNFNKIIGVIKNSKALNTEEEILRIPNYYSENARVFQSNVCLTQKFLHGVVSGDGVVYLKCNIDNYVAESYIILDITTYK